MGKPIQYGLIAEEVAGVFSDLVARSTARSRRLKYQTLDSLQLDELQRQETEIRGFKEWLNRLESKAK